MELQRRMGGYDRLAQARAGDDEGAAPVRVAELLEHAAYDDHLELGRLAVVGAWATG